MKNVRVIKLGTVCVDKATQLTGTITHWTYSLDGIVAYLFQPKGLDEMGQPVDYLCLEAGRFNVKSTDFETVEVPAEILGTQVKDKASGFTGMAVSFMRHINGCFHVYIQPKGLNKKTNSPIKRCDFDLRSCEGRAIKKMTEDELKKSKIETPSPSGGKLNDMPSMRKHN